MYIDVVHATSGPAHPGTWRSWEAGKTILYRKHRSGVTHLIGFNVGDVTEPVCSDIDWETRQPNRGAPLARDLDWQRGIIRATRRHAGGEYSACSVLKFGASWLKVRALRAVSGLNGQLHPRCPGFVRVRPRFP